LTGSVRFYKFKIEKTEPNPNKKNRKKLSQTGKKLSQTGKTEPKRKTEPNRFEPVFVLKNRTELKPIGLNRF